MAKVSPKYNLKVLYPDIAKEWDYEENYPLKPEDLLLVLIRKYGGFVKNNTPGIQQLIVELVDQDVESVILNVESKP